MPKSLSARLSRLLFALLLVVLFFMPASTFVLQVVRHGFELAGHPLSPGLVKVTTGWKEGLLALGGLLFLLIWAARRAFPFRVTYLDWYLLAFLLFGTVVGGLVAGSLGKVAYGFRYDFAVFIFYFLARSVRVSRQRLLAVMGALVWCSLPVLLFGLLQTAVLPVTFMQRFGYHWGGDSPTGNPLPPYHLIGNSIVRAMSTFPGPNSLAMYAGLVFLTVCFLGREWFRPPVRIAWMALSFLTLAATFSRGHLIGIAAAGLIAGCFYYLSARSGPWLRARRWRALSVLTLALLGLLFAGVLAAGALKLGNSAALSFLLHDESTEIHRQVRVEAWQTISTHPLGSGLGTSGLATTNTGGAVSNPESWYIQITQEFGWLGLIFGLGTVVMVLGAAVRMEADLYDETDRRLLYFFLTSFVAVAMSANFLPSWFEVGSITWWVLFGFFMSDYFSSFPAQAASFPIQRKA